MKATTEKYYTISEAAERLGVSTWILRRLPDSEGMRLGARRDRVYTEADLKRIEALLKLKAKSD